MTLLCSDVYAQVAIGSSILTQERALLDLKELVYPEPMAGRTTTTALVLPSKE